MSSFLANSDSGKRTIYLACFREPGKIQRQHFAVFVPSLAKPHRGTLIHVTGGPVYGYTLVFKRNSEPETWPEEGKPCEALIPIGEVDSYHIVDWTGRGVYVYEDTVPIDNLERAALCIEAPRPSEDPVRDLNAPVNDVSGSWILHLSQSSTYADG